MRCTLIFIAAFILTSCEAHQSGEPFVVSGSTMGTGYQLKIAVRPADLSKSRLEAAVTALLERINDQMSTYREDSEVSRFNDSDGLDWFDVSPETARVVAEALRVSELSGGAFDVTIGPLVDLWSFGPEPTTREVPEDEAIAEAQSRSGYRWLEVREAPPALRRRKAGVEIDLSAIAKGFAVDQVAELLQESGIDDFMVEIGGEVRTQGARPDGAPWRIGIETPDSSARSVHEVVEISDLSLATSGDYRNYFEQDGTRYSHMIEPMSGRPVTHSLVSVSVVADSCMLADAMATALLCLGPDRGYDLAIETGLRALFLVREQAGFSRRATPGLDELVVERSQR